MEIIVTKRTDGDLMRLAASYTTGSESKISLTRAYRSEHSIIRTQIFTIEVKGLPLFVSTHLIRHHVGSQPFQLTCRIDRKGGNNHFKEKIDHINALIAAGDTAEAARLLEWLKDNADRYTKVNLLLLVNAQGLIDMAKQRLCSMASPETRQLFVRIVRAVAKADPELAPFLVRKCVYRGGICGEPKSCGFNKTALFRKELEGYKSLFD